ncbi:lanthionine synthetase LanC family protein [Streptomyces afghaniensis]|uniref:lanthionine synthetase LanC family protein n=1 Tax=Streptomyces afghaniensis TaxID=66865 RepID=UPI0037CD039F
MAAIIRPLMLPGDVTIASVAELEEDLVERLSLAEGEYAVTRLGARTPSRIVDEPGAELLARFHEPQTIVEAVISYSRMKGLDPEHTLEEAFPLLEHLVNTRLLVPADSKAAESIEPSLQPGSQVAGFEVRELIQILEDTEVYRAVDERGVAAALKLSRLDSRRAMERRFAREAAILGHLAGRFTPLLLSSGTLEEQPYLLTSWCPGVPGDVAAAALRRRSAAGRPRQLLCQKILEVYAWLHGQGVIHGDVHPRNLLVDDDGCVRIIDFGLARLDSEVRRSGEPARGGVDFYLEPEYVRARLAGRRPPAATTAGEQYSLAALVYHLITGRHYLDFSLEKEALREQIVQDEPRSFGQADTQPWPDVESALRRALSKDPVDRFPDVGAFADAITAADPPDRAASPWLWNTPGSGGRIRLEELLDGLVRAVDFSAPLLTSGLAAAPTCSVNYGAAGIAYALYRVACLREDGALLALADAWANKAADAMTEEGAFYSHELDITPNIVTPVSLYHTASGVHCVQALISQAMGDVVSQQAAVEGFIAESKGMSRNLDLTLGRSGPLLGCALLLESMSTNQLVDTRTLLGHGETVTSGIQDEISRLAPIERCTELPHLGAAHGWAGILYAVLRWSLASGRDVPPAIVARLHELANLTESAGRGVRWPRKVRPPATREGRKRPGNYMSGWCNGSAGFVALWIMAHKVTGDEAYARLAERAGWNAWEVGDTTASLCCGSVGRAYAHLALYRHTGDRAWLERAQRLGDETPDDARLSDPNRYSLFKGELGAALLAADLSCPDASAFPFFEPEG